MFESAKNLGSSVYVDGREQQYASSLASLKRRFPDNNVWVLNTV